ncbi:MAG TPA: 3-isopropylmalate dehydrogenase [Anaerolineales bacterium]|nr:3-isopropylmalate dehydrogenase [Anaerolineales bacterium]
MQAKIVVLPGDGIGPEVTAAAVDVLKAVAAQFGHQFEFDYHLAGGCAIDAHGIALTDEVLAICQASDAVLLGAVGGPKWDNPNATVRPEQGLLKLRKGLNAFANLRPVKPHPHLLASSPLKEERLQGVDLIVIRELTGDIYFGARKREMIDGKERAYDTMEYWDYEIERVVRLAFEIARQRKKHVISVDKANILDCSRLWRTVVERVAKEFPDCTFEHQLVDSAAMRLVTWPASMDVMVTGNMFGDILTDEAAVLTGSMGNLPSASLGDGGPGLYEPIHGSAPDIAGKGIANPIGTILSAAMLLRHSLKLTAEADAVESAVNRALSEGCRTVDLRRENALSTVQMTAEILKRL